MIYSQSLEKRVLSGLAQNQHCWASISEILTDKDFYSEDSLVHKSIFLLFKHALNNKEALDDVILIERLKNLNVSFPDSIDLEDYIRNLFTFSVSEEVFLNSVRELKKYTVRREVSDSCRKMAKYVKSVDPKTSFMEIVDNVDKIHNETLKKFESGGKKFNNLFEAAPDMIEERGNNPIEEFGLMGPHPKINSIFGSLLRPGNMSVICARTGSGKTSFAMDYTTKVAAQHKVPVLHFDNGEMSEEELVYRQVSAMTKLPMWLFETGKWRTASYGDMSQRDVVYTVRTALQKIKSMDFYYENVAGMTPDEMCALLKRFYFSEVGRGNPLVFSFDYVKQDFSTSDQSNGWAKIAYMIHKFKQCIHREICFDGQPQVGMLTSVQANRSGIITNKSYADIVEDEGVVGLSDQIMQFCSHLFLLRRKVIEELSVEGEQFGTHKLIPLKFRHLGKDIDGALLPVELPDGSKRQNFINLEIKNFGVKEKGDLRDIVRVMDLTNIQPHETDENEGLPDSLR